MYQVLSPPPKGPGDDMDEATSVYINTCLHEVKIEAHPHTAKEKSASSLLVYEGMDWLIYPILLVLDLPLLMHIKRYNYYVVLEGHYLISYMHVYITVKLYVHVSTLLPQYYLVLPLSSNFSSVFSRSTSSMINFIQWKCALFRILLTTQPAPRDYSASWI